jgi:hypothetical protein
MIWSRSEQWMLTGDDKGYIKYWQANMNNVKMEQGHAEAIRGLRYIKLRMIVKIFLILSFNLFLMNIYIQNYNNKITGFNCKNIYIK